MKKDKRGQSILEYVIILTAIVVVIIAAKDYAIKPNVKKVMVNAGIVVGDAANNLLTGM